MMGPKLREETAHMVGVRELKIAFREVRPRGHRGHGDTMGIDGPGTQGTMTTGRAGAGPGPGCVGGCGGLRGGDPTCGRRSST